MLVDQPFTVVFLDDMSPENPLQYTVLQICCYQKKPSARIIWYFLHFFAVIAMKSKHRARLDVISKCHAYHTYHLCERS